MLGDKLNQHEHSGTPAKASYLEQRTPVFDSNLQKSLCTKQETPVYAVQNH